MHRSHATILPSSNSLLTLWSQSLSAEATCKTRKYLDNTWFSLIRRAITIVEADFKERLNILNTSCSSLKSPLAYIDKSHSMTFPSITKRNKVHFLAELLDDDNIKMQKKIQQYATIHPALPRTENGESNSQILPDKQTFSRNTSVLSQPLALPPQHIALQYFFFYLVWQLTTSPPAQILFDSTLHFSIFLNCSRNIRKIV